MRRACPYRGENPGPGKDALESLTTGPELENSQGQTLSSATSARKSDKPREADISLDTPDRPLSGRSAHVATAQVAIATLKISLLVLA
jgi:hypothetical protein